MTVKDKNVEKIANEWGAIRKKIREHWPELTQDDLKMIDGDSRKVVALINQKTGENVNEIEEVIDDIASESNGLMARLSGQFATSTEKAADSISHASERTLHQTQDTISTSPLKSLAIGLGAGLVTGLLIASFVRPPQPRHSQWWDRG